MQKIRIEELKKGSHPVLWATRSLLIVAILAFVAQAGASSKTVTIEYRFFPGLAKMGGN